MGDVREVHGKIRPRPGGDGALEAVIWLDGKRQRKALALRVGQEAEAQKILDQALAELRGRPAAATDGALTARAWGDQWNADRKAREKREWVNERAHLDYFLYPVLGDAPLASVTDVAMLDWARGLERQPGPSGKLPSPKYIRKITATARLMFKDALRRHLIERTPCLWEDNDLPELEARAGAMSDGFELQEVARLVYDQRIPEDRRVLYALEFLTGMRTGEAAARTWADWEPEYGEDLGRLLVRTAYNTRHHVVKATKTKVEKWIPVHPALAELLGAWKREGWERYFGRAPTPEDLIVPAREGGPRNNSYSWRTFKQDLELLGLRTQRHYETRSTFINLAEGAGASPEVVRRITHPSIRDAKDLYSRARLRWPAMCAAVKVIRLLPPPKVGGTVGGATHPNPLKCGGRARESDPPAAPFSTTHRF